MVREWLETLLPEDAHERCRGRVHLLPEVFAAHLLALCTSINHTTDTACTIVSFDQGRHGAGVAEFAAARRCARALQGAHPPTVWSISKLAGQS